MHSSAKRQALLALQGLGERAVELEEVRAQLAAAQASHHKVRA